MNMHTHTISKAKKGVITRTEYNSLIERMEELEDRLDLLNAQDKGESKDAWSSDLVERMIAGEHPLRLWREHRGINKRTLSKKSGVSESYLSEIETGKKPGSVSALSKCAKALNIDISDLVI